MADISKEKEEALKREQLSQQEKVKEALRKIRSKESKFLFAVAQTPNPAASIYEIYFHATVVKRMGYNVKILTDVSNYEIPDWIEPELTNFEHISMEKLKLTVGPEDILIIPEIFSNVMEATKNLPCIRVGFLQSIDYMLNALIPGTDWSTFGINKIITTSDNLKDIVKEYFGKNYDINIYNVGVPDYFVPSKKPKNFIISIVGRNTNEIAKVVKLFYAKYPEYSFVTFDTMLTNSKPPKTMRRIDYANRLSENFAGVWIDRIASFGTFPIECMKCKTIPIALVPDIIPEYLIDNEGKIKENTGIWTQDIYAIPILIGDLITKFLDDTIDNNVFNVMTEIGAKYNQKDAESQLQVIYQKFLNERIELFEKTIKINEPSIVVEPPTVLQNNTETTIEEQK